MKTGLRRSAPPSCGRGGPPPSRASRRSSVITLWTLSSFAMTDRLRRCELGGVGHHDHLPRDRIIIALSWASSTSGVVRPISGSRPSTPRNSRSALRPRSVCSACGPDQRIRHLAQDAPDHDHAHVGQVGQLHRDVQGVGDHGERLQLQELDVPRDLRGGGARVQHHRLVVPDHLGGGVADADLLAVVQRLLDVDGHVLEGARRASGPRRASGSPPPRCERRRGRRGRSPRRRRSA